MLRSVLKTLIALFELIARLIELFCDFSLTKALLFFSSLVFGKPVINASSSFSVVNKGDIGGTEKGNGVIMLETESRFVRPVATVPGLSEPRDSPS